ncbi:hypothetical protein PYCC9005_002240 [Savitreella phatthalungensis]
MAEELRAFGLTHVLYPVESGLVGYGCAVLALVPQAMLVWYGGVVYSRRQWDSVWMLAGQLACEGLNDLLKKAIRQPRPQTRNFDGYGMPSSHAQFMGYFAAYMVLTAHPLEKVPAVVLAVAVAGSRVFLAYHSVEQVIVGVVVGVVFGVVWATVARRAVEPLWPLITRNPISNLLRMKDTETNLTAEHKAWLARKSK